MSGHRLNSQLLSARNQTQTWKIIKKNTSISDVSIDICFSGMLQNCRKYNYF